MKDAFPLDLCHKIALNLNRQLEKQTIDKYPLRQLFWECTLRCNLSCRHCGSDCHTQAKIKDMPIADFLKVVDNIAAAKENDPNNILVIFTGGEPLMRSDLEECGRELIKRGFPWGMVTNGYAMSPKRLQSLINAGLHSITVSLDGFEDEHNWMRGRKESFARAANTVTMLTKTPITHDVVTCVNKKNIGKLKEFKEYLISIGLKNWRLFSIFPSGRAANDEMLKLTNEEFKYMLDFIIETRKEGKIKASFGCDGFLGNYEGEVRDNFFRCQAGITVASVLADGAISSCPSIRANYHQGNIYNDDFIEVWRNGFKPYRDREWMRKDDCAECKLFKYCKGEGMHLRDDDGNLTMCHAKMLL